MLEKHSGLKWKQDFFVGYSPERINPGDKEHTLTKIIKVVSGDTPETLERVAEVYGSVITAGVYKASSIKVAEAAKVIENTQRDLNIALVNELSLIFHRIGIDTLEVLEAAGTKWNFLPFRPGLVGGHCIGVDPYYLTHKAEMLGYHPQVILAGRRINDGMGKYVAEQTVKHMIQPGFQVKGAHVIVLGLTFKENCPDLRNSKVIDVIRELRELRRRRCTCTTRWPSADEARARVRRRAGAVGAPAASADAIVAAVAHKELAEHVASTDCSTKLSHGRRLRRRQVHGRRAGVAARGASTSGACDGASDDMQHALLDTLSGAAAPLARDRQRRLHRLAPARGAAALRPAGGQPRQLRHRPPAQPRRRCARRVGATRWARHRFIEGDIADADACRAACDGVDFVLHQAALGSVPRSIDDPLATHRANVTGFLNMLVAARDAGVARFVYAASSSTYGDSPDAAQGRRRDRPAAVAVCGHQVRERAVCRRVRPLLRPARRSACATSTCSARARIPKAPTPR